MNCHRRGFPVAGIVTSVEYLILAFLFWTVPSWAQFDFGNAHLAAGS